MINFDTQWWAGFWYGVVAGLAIWWFDFWIVKPVKKAWKQVSREMKKAKADEAKRVL
jgi:hypothetical protein